MQKIQQKKKGLAISESKFILLLFSELVVLFIGILIGFMLKKGQIYSVQESQAENSTQNSIIINK